MTLRAQVVSEARTWLKTPYHHQAAVKGVGVDCAMLLVSVFKAVGLAPTTLDPRPYPNDWHMHRSEEKFLGWLGQYGTSVESPQPGDVAVWRFGRTFSHGAIVVDADGTIVHAYMDAGCVVLGNLSESALAERPVRYWRVNGIDGAAEVVK